MKQFHIKKFICESCRYMVAGKTYCKHGGKQVLKGRCGMKKRKIKGIDGS